MLQKLFGFDPAVTSVRKEIIAGVTTFLTLAYILAVNPSVLSVTGMDKGAVFTSTIVASAVATFVMAFYGKLPFALAPSMGLSSFFAFTICTTMGYSWQFALTAVFIEGILFMIMSVTGLRSRLVDAMPQVLQNAVTPGIGLFITFIGLKNSGLVVSHPATFVALGDMHSPAVLLAIGGILLTSMLLIRKVMGALLIGIVATTLVGIPLGVTHLQGFYSAPPSLAPVVWKMEWNHIFSYDMAACVITFLFVDMFDTLGTLVGVCSRAGIPMTKGARGPLARGFMADAIGTTAGAALGTSTISTFMESAAGVNAGGRSGLTAFVVGLCFMASLFFAPLFLSIPAEATSAALFLVGVTMMSDTSNINFNNYLDAVPCFFMIIFMPFAFSISDGILLGVISYVVLYLLSGHVKDLRWATVVLSLIFLLRYVMF